MTENSPQSEKVFITTSSLSKENWFKRTIAKYLFKLLKFKTEPEFEEKREFSAPFDLLL